MLLILFGTMAKMAAESREYLESVGFENVTKLSYSEKESVMKQRYGSRTYASLEEVLACDFTYSHTDHITGFNKDQIIDAVTGRKDCVLHMSAYSIDFVEQLKMAYGDYVVTVFVYTDRFLLERITDSLPDITQEEKALRMKTGRRIRELFMEKRPLFDEVVLYGGEDSLYDIAYLKVQYDHIIKKAKKRQQQLNNRHYVEMPYSGSDNYIFVSYSHDDKDTVYPILSMLQQNGCRVWYDEGIKGGANWRRLLTDKIEKCFVFFLFSSENSCVSEEVQVEIDTAMDCRKDIVTIRLDDAAFERAYEIRLKRMQSVFYSHDNFREKLLESVPSAVQIEKT